MLPRILTLVLMSLALSACAGVLDICRDGPDPTPGQSIRR